MSKLSKASEQVLEVHKNEPKNIVPKLIVVIVLGFLLVWSISGISININKDGLIGIRNILKTLIYPGNSTHDGSSYVVKYILSFETGRVPQLMYETIMIAFMGTLIGGILSVPIAFIASKNITGRYVSTVGVIFITMLRTLPVFIWALLFVTVKTGPFSGVLAIGITSIGMISKLFIESIEDIDKGILEALDSTGATTLQKIRFGIMPQLTASFLSTIIYRFEINVKNSTILGLVGAGGIGMLIQEGITTSNFPLVSVSLWGIIPTVLLIEFISTKIRNRLATGE